MNSEVSFKSRLQTAWILVFHAEKRSHVEFVFLKVADEYFRCATECSLNLKIVNTENHLTDFNGSE